jgi:hypothetical protein
VDRPLPAVCDYTSNIKRFIVTLHLWRLLHQCATSQGTYFTYKRTNCSKCHISNLLISLWHNQTLTHPQVVQHSYYLLKLQRYVNINVLVEAWLKTTFLREWGPIVSSCCNEKMQNYNLHRTCYTHIMTLLPWNLRHCFSVCLVIHFDSLSLILHHDLSFHFHIITLQHVNSCTTFGSCSHKAFTNKKSDIFGYIWNWRWLLWHYLASIPTSTIAYSFTWPFQQYPTTILC